MCIQNSECFVIYSMLWMLVITRTFNKMCIYVCGCSTLVVAQATNIQIKQDGKWNKDESLESEKRRKQKWKRENKYICYRVIRFECVMSTCRVNKHTYTQLKYRTAKKGRGEGENKIHDIMVFYSFFWWKKGERERKRKLYIIF